MLDFLLQILHIILKILHNRRILPHVFPLRHITFIPAHQLLHRRHLIVYPQARLQRFNVIPILHSLGEILPHFKIRGTQGQRPFEISGQIHSHHAIHCTKVLLF